MADTPAVATPTPDGGAQPEGGTQTPQTPAIDPTAQVTPPAEKPPEKPPEPKPEPRFYERKINGKADKIPAEAIDAAAAALGVDPKELLSAAQLRAAGYERLEEARKIQKQMEALKERDPWDLAKELRGMDDAALDQLAEQRLIAKLQREAMDPAQRQVLEAQEKVAKERAALEAQQKEFAERQVAAQAQVYQERLETLMIDGVEKAGLPRTPAVMRAVAGELEKQHRFGLPLDIDDAIRSVQAGTVKPVVATLRGLPVDKLIAELGEDAYRAILAHSIAQKAGPTTPPTPPAAAPAAKPGKSWVSWNDFDKDVG